MSHAIDDDAQGHWCFWQEFHAFNGRTEFDYSCRSLSSLPIDLDALCELTKFDLYQNQIQSLPVEIGHLHLLTYLDLGNNQLTSLPGEIGQLQALKEFVVSENRLVALPTTICNLSSLTHFWIFNNQLTSLPVEIGRLSSLETLVVYNNQLESLPQSIGQLRSLTLLYINSNRLSELPATIGRLQSLRQLFLDDNMLQRLPLHLLVELPHLQCVLYCGNTLVTMPTLHSLQWHSSGFKKNCHVRLRFASEHQHLGAALLAVLSSHRSTMQFAEPICHSVFRHVVNDLIDDDELVRCVHRMCVSCARVFSQRDATHNV